MGRGSVWLWTSHKDDTLRDTLEQLHSGFTSCFTSGNLHRLRASPSCIAFLLAFLHCLLRGATARGSCDFIRVQPCFHGEPWPSSGSCDLTIWVQLCFHGEPWPGSRRRVCRSPPQSASVRLSPFPCPVAGAMRSHHHGPAKSARVVFRIPGVRPSQAFGREPALNCHARLAWFGPRQAWLSCPFGQSPSCSGDTIPVRNHILAISPSHSSPGHGPDSTR